MMRSVTLTEVELPSTPAHPDSEPSGRAGGVESVRDALAEAVAGKSAQARLSASGSHAVPDPYLTAAERAERGRLERAEAPRSSLGEWAMPADRADPVELLVGQEESRVQELVPVRHARMGASAFTFYRGSALVMASDLSSQPQTALCPQLCGDAHLSNFGLFGAPDRSVVFDVNDFDETHPGPFEWDVKRLATSFVLAARDSAMSDEVGIAAAVAAASSYRQTMTQFAGESELDLWYHRVDSNQLEAAVHQVATRKQREMATSRPSKTHREVQKAVRKARARDAWSVVNKITEVVDGKRQFRNQPPLLERLDMNAEAAAMASDLYVQYLSTLEDDRRELLSRYEMVDIGHKVVGVGSVGLLAFALLMRGRDEDDLMVLQVKQAQASVLEGFTKDSAYSQHGRRVVTGQRLMQATGDSFLGWVDGPSGRDYYVRQLRDMKWSPDPGSLTSTGLHQYAVMCGNTLARAHARSGDAVCIAAYLGSGSNFDKAMGSFSVVYADQVLRDFEAFTAAISDSRITAAE
jgi:uncharacterized protein (DUF2252 family)